MLISANVASLVHRLFPFLDWGPAHQREWLLPDVFAGLALWAVMVPEGMAYAGIVGVPHCDELTTVTAFARVRDPVRQRMELGKMEAVAGPADFYERITDGVTAWQHRGSEKS